jgi:hypothetical protein
MVNGRGRGFLALVVVLGLAAAPSAARATTVLVPMSDADLVRTSALVVVGTARRIESLALRDGRILSEITLGVERTLKGEVASGTVVVTAPGGSVGDRTVQVFGAPEFAVGETVLLFLRRAAGGRLRTTALALGKYHVDRQPGARARAWRTVPDLDVRDLDGFLADIGRLAASEPQERTATGRVTLDPTEVVGRTVTDRYTFLGGAPYRWFEGVVALGLANADAALGPVTTRTLLDGALAAWTDVATAALVLQTGPSTPTAPSVAGGVCDGRSTIQFDDPFEEVDDLAGCSGVLAVGGFCATGQTAVVSGTTFRRIVEGDVTMNDGVGACWGATNVAEVLTHEVGHAIGLGHSADRDATMYAFAHFDGRGAAVRADDVAGVSFIYPVGAATTTSTTTSTTRTTTSTSTSSSTRTTSSTSSTSTSRTSTSANTTSSTTTSSSRTTSSTSRTSTTASSTSSSSTSTSTQPIATTSTTTLPPNPEADTDGDGVTDAADACPGTPAGDLVGPEGCSRCPCELTADGTPWPSRRAYLSCVRSEAEAQLAAGLITPAEARAAIKHARLSTCGSAAQTIRCCFYADPDETGPGLAKCRITRRASCRPRGPRVDWTENVETGSCLPSPCRGPQGAATGAD